MGLVFRVDATPPEVLTAFLLFPEAGLGDKPGSRAEGFSTAAHLVYFDEYFLVPGACWC